MITPDPNLPEHHQVAEPNEWTVGRIEATAMLYEGPAPACPSGCTMERRSIVEMGGELPKVLGYEHQRSCQLWEPMQ